MFNTFEEKLQSLSQGLTTMTPEEILQTLDKLSNESHKNTAESLWLCNDVDKCMTYCDFLIRITTQARVQLETLQKKKIKQEVDERVKTQIKNGKEQTEKIQSKARLSNDAKQIKSFSSMLAMNDEQLVPFICMQLKHMSHERVKNALSELRKRESK